MRLPQIFQGVTGVFVLGVQVRAGYEGAYSRTRNCLFAG